MAARLTPANGNKGKAGKHVASTKTRALSMIDADVPQVTRNCRKVWPSLFSFNFLISTTHSP